MCLVVHICARLEPLHTCKEVKGGMSGVLVYTLYLFPWDRVFHQIQSSLMLNTVDDQQTPAKVLSLPPGLIGVYSKSQILCGFEVTETWPSCLLRKLSYPLKHLCGLIITFMQDCDSLQNFHSILLPLLNTCCVLVPCIEKYGFF